MCYFNSNVYRKAWLPALCIVISSPNYTCLVWSNHCTPAGPVGASIHIATAPRIQGLNHHWAHPICLQLSPVKVSRAPSLPAQLTTVCLLLAVSLMLKKLSLGSPCQQTSVFQEGSMPDHPLDWTKPQVRVVQGCWKGCGASHRTRVSPPEQPVLMPFWGGAVGRQDGLLEIWAQEATSYLSKWEMTAAGVAKNKPLQVYLLPKTFTSK